jgi:hypothetical protein
MVDGLRIDRQIGDRRAVHPGPRDALVFPELEQEAELLGEQLVVAPEIWSSVAKCWNTRTGSSELRTVTALVRRMRRVRPAAVARTTWGTDTA